MTLDYTAATAKLQEDGSIMCHHEVISEKGLCGFTLILFDFKDVQARSIYKFALLTACNTVDRI